MIAWLRVQKQTFSMDEVCSINIRFGEEFVDAFGEARGFFRAQQASRDAAADAIEQFEPVFKGWIIETSIFADAALALVEKPAIANTSSVDFEAFAFGAAPFPTDFSFGHNSG